MFKGLNFVKDADVVADGIAHWGSSYNSKVYNSRNGFTLVELMVTIAVVAILAAIAIPVFRLPTTSAEAKTLLGTLEYARTVAINQGQSVVICPSTDSATCAGGTNWATGWIVLIPSGTGGCVAAAGTTGTVLRVQQALTSNDTATFANVASGTTANFCFLPQGFIFAANAGIVKFNTPNVPTNERCTVVAGVGHVQMVSQGQTDITGALCQ